MHEGLRRRQLDAAGLAQRAERGRAGEADLPAVELLARHHRDGDQAGAVDDLQAFEGLLEGDGVSRDRRSSSSPRRDAGRVRSRAGRSPCALPASCGQRPARWPRRLLGQVAAGTHQRRGRAVAVPCRLRVKRPDRRALGGCRPGSCAVAFEKSRRLPCADDADPLTPKLGPAKTSIAATAARTARSSACLKFMLSPPDIAASSCRGRGLVRAILRPLSARCQVTRAARRRPSSVSRWCSR